MGREVKYFIGGGVCCFVVVALAAFFLGPDVTVQTSNDVVNAGAGGRFVLSVHEEGDENGETIETFSIIDSKDGKVYVFRPQDAHHVLPSAGPDADAATAESE